MRRSLSRTASVPILLLHVAENLTQAAVRKMESIYSANEKPRSQQAADTAGFRSQIKSS